MRYEKKLVHIFLFISVLSLILVGCTRHTFDNQPGLHAEKVQHAGQKCDHDMILVNTGHISCAQAIRVSAALLKTPSIHVEEGYYCERSAKPTFYAVLCRKKHASFIIAPPNKSYRNFPMWGHWIIDNTPYRMTDSDKGYDFILTDGKDPSYKTECVLPQKIRLRGIICNSTDLPSITRTAATPDRGPLNEIILINNAAAKTARSTGGALFSYGKNKELPIGSSLFVAGYACHRTSELITCVDINSRHGFLLSRQQWREYTLN